ncbi:hypothetical protein FRC07_014556 [Ceratobasidium sp. 392]|nr:hypothetical protein FRC07_014556 [Ceratobasidium sp. 392]
MDDDYVTSCPNPPINHKNAYVLFYIQSDKALPTPSSATSNLFGGIKRTRDDIETNGSDKPRQIRTTPWDVFGPSNKKARVESTGTGKEGVAGPSRLTPAGVATSSPTKPLVAYPSTDDIEDPGEPITPTTAKPVSPTLASETSTVAPSTTTPITPPKGQSASPRKTPSTPTPKSLDFAPITTTYPNGINPSTFYGPSKKKDKDKRGGTNPYSALAGSGNLHAKKEQLEIKSQMGFDNFGGSKVKNRMKGKGA